MAVDQSNAFDANSDWTRHPYATFPNLRVLAWSGSKLFASRGYTLLAADTQHGTIAWERVANFHPSFWRNWTARSPLTSRLLRDGFHALVALQSGHLVGAVPGAIVTLLPGASDFQISHVIQRGTRPLHLCSIPGRAVLFGEYFDNPHRDDVHLYASIDDGISWEVAHTFPGGEIRHVHNILFDRWADCLWIFTGDDGSECRILRCSTDLKHFETVLSGNQQTRAVAAIIREDGLYFSSDTPFEHNHVYHLTRSGVLRTVGDLPSSSIYGCAVGDSIFFSTMAEPSQVNTDKEVCIFQSRLGSRFEKRVSWQKDRWPMKYFQYGNLIFPDGDSPTSLLAFSTIAVRDGDMRTYIRKIAG